MTRFWWGYMKQDRKIQWKKWDQIGISKGE